MTMVIVCSLVKLGSAQVRFNAMQAQVTQTMFAANFLHDRWARAKSFRVALTCSMTGC